MVRVNQFWLAAVLAAGGAGGQVPSNDACSTPVLVAPGVNPIGGGSFTNVGATASNPPAFCAPSGKDVWFSFTPTATADYRIETCTPPGLPAGTLVDSVVVVFAGCPAIAPNVGCDDDGCGTLSSAVAALFAGVDYRIGVASKDDGPGGTFRLSISYVVPPSTNDDCATAVALAAGVNGPFHNVAAAASAGPAPCAGAGARDLWFTYLHGGPSGPTVVSTGCGGYDTVVEVSTACGAAPLVCATDAPGCGPGAAAVQFPAVQGSSYVIRVASESGPSGVFPVIVARAPGTTCAAPTPVGLGPNGPFSTAFAAPGVPGACAGSGLRDAWFVYVHAGCGGWIEATTGCFGDDTALEIYAGCGGPLLACNDDDLFCGAGGARASFPAASGGVYAIKVDAWGPSPTTFTLTLSTVPGGLAHTVTQPFGSGSARIDLVGGPPSGGWFLAVAFLDAGVAPAGAFFGVDLSLAELFLELQPGSPFFGPLGPCGDAVVGPFTGVPPGLVVDVVALAFATPWPGVPVAFSAATTETLP